MIKFDGSISAYSIQADVWSKSKSIFALIHYEKKKIFSIGRRHLLLSQMEELGKLNLIGEHSLQRK